MSFKVKAPRKMPLGLRGTPTCFFGSMRSYPLCACARRLNRLVRHRGGIAGLGAGASPHPVARVYVHGGGIDLRAVAVAGSEPSSVYLTTAPPVALAMAALLFATVMVGAAVTAEAAAAT